MSATMTIRLEPALKQRLDNLAEATQRSKSFLAAQAIREFVDLNEWQVEEIRNALVEADNEEFASDDFVREVLDLPPFARALVNLLLFVRDGVLESTPRSPRAV